MNEIPLKRLGLGTSYLNLLIGFKIDMLNNPQHVFDLFAVLIRSLIFRLKINSSDILSVKY